MPLLQLESTADSKSSPSSTAMLIVAIVVIICCLLLIIRLDAYGVYCSLVPCSVISTSTRRPIVYITDAAGQLMYHTP